jgi:hypothetical protein
MYGLGSHALYIHQHKPFLSLLSLFLLWSLLKIKRRCIRWDYQCGASLEVTAKSITVETNGIMKLKSLNYYDTYYSGVRESSHELYISSQ